jgi:hypothetical protein
MSFSERYASEKTAGFPPPQESGWDWPSGMHKDFMDTDSTLPELSENKCVMCKKDAPDSKKFCGPECKEAYEFDQREINDPRNKSLSWDEGRDWVKSKGWEAL